MDKQDQNQIMDNQNIKSDAAALQLIHRGFRVDWPSAGILESALREIVRNMPFRFTDSETACRIFFRFEEGFSGLRIMERDDGIEITYSRKSDALRALAIATAGGCRPGNIEEFSTFSSLGVMLDVSRNSVLTVDSLKRLFRHFALMGINEVQLYMEDIYEIEGEPFFGYFRGRYSVEELREIDLYGGVLGINVIPCIQTLGHLEQILQWPVYSGLIDSAGVLLAGEPQTYKLIERMLDAVASCFRTKQIHIGMDEAHGIGLGRYRSLHGDCQPFDVFNAHLRKVTELCKERGLQPMIWSDMYFRLGSATNDYYDLEARIPDHVAAEIPAEVELVYWDYYHADSSFYAEWIGRHRAMGKEPIFSAGAWSWGRFWTDYPVASSSISAGMQAARESNLKKAFVTLWGDDGDECDPFSTLPTVQFFTECAYGQEAKIGNLPNKFLGSCEENLEWCLLGNEVDVIPALLPSPDSYGNFGKWILWHDPILNFLDKHIPAVLPSHYEALAAKLKLCVAAEKTAIHLQFITKLAETLAGKARLHVEIRQAYREKNFEMLRSLLCQTVPKTIELLRELESLHRRIWHEWKKPFGWDVLERRYAGIISRMESLRIVMESHINDPQSGIPELEEETFRVDETSRDVDLYFTYQQSSNANAK